MASLNCSLEAPFASQVLTDNSAYNITVLVIGALLTLVVLGIFIWQLICVRRHRWRWSGKSQVICLLGIYPVITSLCFISLMVPRSSTLIDLLSSVYLSFCIGIFLRLMMIYHGGREQMLLTLSEEVLVLRGPPCCCCCCCLPKVKITEKVIERVSFAVFQLVIIRPVVMILVAVLWANGSYNPGRIAPDEPTIYLTVINLISTLTAVYGLILTFRISRKSLQKHLINRKLSSLQLAVIFTNLQNTLINILVRAGVIPCIQLYNRAMHGERIDHFTLIIVMSFQSLLAYSAYRQELQPQEEKEQNDQKPVEPSPKSFHEPVSFVNQAFEQRI